MSTRMVTAVTVLAVAGAALIAQAPQTPAEPIRVNRLINRPDFRLSRNEILPHSTRSAHRHDDSRFHVLVPLTGPLELAIEGEPPRHLEPWQPHLMEGGTMHSFTNPSDATVQFMEIFVQKTDGAARLDLDDIVATGLLARR